VKILDFGLAKLKGVSNLTKDSSTLGTIRYMSPEQVRGEEVDTRSDIWSVAVIIYELMTGRVPFKGDYDQAVLYSILSDDPDPIAIGNDQDKKQVEFLVKKALTKDPDNRYQNIEQFHQALKNIMVSGKTDDIPKTSERINKRRKQILVYSGFLVIILLSVLITFFEFGKGKNPIDSIAVLPLSNLSGDPLQEYFSDGMTEAVISELANIKALKVISRTSVMRYKNTDELLPDIADELHVEAIVEGSVLRAGDRVRISAQLIQAAEDKHLWAKNYERDMKDVILLQREVASDIAKEIHVSLSEQEKVTLKSSRQLNPEAHEAFLRGLYHWNKRSEADLRKSIDYYEKAIELDPDYAEAYAGLAHTYIVMAAWNFMDHEEASPKERYYAEKSLELNGNLAAGYVALAANLEGDWNWGEAEEAYKKAIEKSPNYATAHQWNAEFLSILGRHEEALKEMKLAMDLDPLSLIIIHNMGVGSYYARAYDEAEYYLNKVIELDTSFGAPHYFLYLIYLARGENRKAINAMKKMLAKNSETVDLVEMVEKTFETGGMNEFRRWSIDYMLSSPYQRIEHDIAMNYAALGKADSAFFWIEKQVNERNNWTKYLKVDPGFDSVRSDPRFNEILKRMNLIP